MEKHKKLHTDTGFGYYIIRTYIMKAGYLNAQSKQVDWSYNHWNNQGSYKNIIMNLPNGGNSK